MIIFFKYLIYSFSIFLMGCAIFMFFKPKSVRTIILKAGSTKVIHFGELIIRALIGLSFVLSSFLSNDQLLFKIAGYFLLSTAIFIMVLPRKLHQSFTHQSVSYLSPFLLKILSPISAFAGYYVLKSYLSN